MKTKDYINIEMHYGANNYAPLDVVLTKGLGVWVEDIEGNRYLDCLSAYSAVNQGHCHPKILQTALEQMQKLTLTSRAFRNNQLALLYKELCELTHSHKVLPMNTGAEAVESAIKVVRKWGYQVKGVPEGQAEIIVCENNFHGRTIAIVGFSSDEGSRAGFGPFPQGFKIIPFGDVEAFEDAITPNTVGFMVEPIQGEAGVLIPPKGYLKNVREICTKHNVMLVLDEIQTGLGRTGKLLAEEHEGIEADLTLIGKALSGGFYPVSAVLSNTEVMDVDRGILIRSRIWGAVRFRVGCKYIREDERTMADEQSHPLVLFILILPHPVGIDRRCILREVELQICKTDRQP